MVEKTCKEMIYNRGMKEVPVNSKDCILHMLMEWMNESIQCQCDNVQNCVDCLVPEISFSQQAMCTLKC